MRLYVDMDGVLTDFDTQAEKILGKKTDPNADLTSKDWAKISKAGKDYWAKMPWLSDGKKLWDSIKDKNPTILTAPSEDASCIVGKKEWLSKELPGIPYIIEGDKYKYADKDAVLIDDRDQNIEKWEDAGGIPIKHTDAESTLEEFRKIWDDDMMDKKAYVINTFDDVADDLEARGYIKEAYELDIITNTLERTKFSFLEKSEDRFKSFMEQISKRSLGLVKAALKKQKDPKATRIYSKLEELQSKMQDDPIKDKFENEEIKKSLRNQAFDLGTDLATLISEMLKDTRGLSEMREKDKNIEDLYKKIVKEEKEVKVDVDPIKDKWKAHQQRLKELGLKSASLDLNYAIKKANEILNQLLK